MKEITFAICTLEHLKVKPVETDSDIIVVSPEKPDFECLWFKSVGTLPEDRNIALENCKTKYILYIANKYLNENQLQGALVEMHTKDWIGAGIQIIAVSKNIYLQACMNIRYKYRFNQGEKKNIGTPQIWDTDIVKKYKFSRSAGYSDDTDLCERLYKDGYRFGYINAYCAEVVNRKSLEYRFIMYGKSDNSYYMNHRAGWSLFRKIRSILHPITAEFVPNLFYLPFYVWIVVLRYRGWILGK
jgi:hypothetical protein